jgi:Dyp-type peroxidase family
MVPTRTPALPRTGRDGRAPVARTPGTVSRSGLDQADVQGMVGSGYGRLPEAEFLGLRIDDGAGGRTALSALLPQVTSMASRRSSRALNVALTHTGLAQLGLPGAALDGFSLEFRAGMVTRTRSAFLGDEGDNAPSTWAWGGPGTPRVDVLLFLYAESAAELAEFRDSVRRLIGSGGIVEVVALPTAPLSPRDHLGFTDGISQPEVADLHGVGADADVPLGELLLGYPNAYRKRTGRPFLPAEADPAGVLPPAPRAEAPDSVDFGRNGTYLVIRTLAVDVAAFWEHAGRWAVRTGLPPDQIAAKMVGRWPSGTSLTVSPDHDDDAQPVDNGFRYHRDGDVLGLGCPIAAHVRRANPRDSLDPRPGSDRAVRVNSRHRLLRRGRQYGPPPGDPGAAGPERGLHFVCLNANLSRQFEFVQHTWLNNPAFAGLQDSPDPIAGHRTPGTGVFPIPATPVRHRLLDLPEFTRVRGGGYFFMPGIRALAYLASGPVTPGSVAGPADGSPPGTAASTRRSEGPR